jgi:hypothetical protein
VHKEALIRAQPIKQAYHGHASQELLGLFLKILNKKRHKKN